MGSAAHEIRHLIRRSGKTQAALALEIGMDAPKLSKSLRGQRRFTSEELQALAAALSVSVSQLAIPGATALAARASSGGSLETAVDAAHRYLDLRRLLVDAGLPQTWDLLPEPFSGRGRFIDQGAQMAERARERVVAAGVDIQAPLWELIPKVFGVDVGAQPLDDGVDGLAAADDHSRLILVNTTPVASRQRFTMAHELGHLLASDDQQIHRDENIYSDASRRGEGEMRANAFAAAFLMPEERLRDVTSFDAFCDVATDLGVSPSALAWRLLSLGKVDAATRAEWAGTTSAAAAQIAGRPELLAERMRQSMASRLPRLLAKDSELALAGGDITLEDYSKLIAPALAVEPAQEGTPSTAPWEDPLRL